MAIKDINELKGKFADDKEPNGADFGDFMDSFYHRSTRISQNNILGLNDDLDKLEAEKASNERVEKVEKEVSTKAEIVRVQNIENNLPNFATKDDLQNVMSGLNPMGDALNMTDLETKPKRHNDSYFVKDQLDANGNPYIFRYDGGLGEWINTKRVVYENVMTKAELGKFRLWLKNKGTNYTSVELSAINKIIDLKLIVLEKLDTDIYTVNILREYNNNIQFSIFKNGVSHVSASAPLGTTEKIIGQNSAATCRVEVVFNMELGDTSLNTTSSQIQISPNVIETYESYILGLKFEERAITRNEYGIRTSSTGIWSDGSAGVLTDTDYNSQFLAYDGYSITHAATFKKLVKPKITRDSLGAPVTIPNSIVEKQ